MNINELTFGQMKEIIAMLGKSTTGEIVGPWQIGQTYLIRTVTMIDTGRLVAVWEHELVLEDAAWIADTGRFSDAVAKAEFAEVEPFPDGKLIVGRGAVIDAFPIRTAPRAQK